VLLLAVIPNQFRIASNACRAVRTFDRRKMNVANYFRDRLPPGSLIATDAIGIVGYITKMPILDILGTVDRHIAHAEVPMGGGLPGHEKYDADYVFEREPDVIYIPISAEGRILILPVWEKIWYHPLLHERYEVIEDAVSYYRRKSGEPEAQSLPVSIEKPS